MNLLKLELFKLEGMWFFDSKRSFISEEFRIDSSNQDCSFTGFVCMSFRAQPWFFLFLRSSQRLELDLLQHSLILIHSEAEWYILQPFGGFHNFRYLKSQVFDTIVSEEQWQPLCFRSHPKVLDFGCSPKTCNCFASW